MKLKSTYYICEVKCLTQIYRNCASEFDRGHGHLKSYVDELKPCINSEWGSRSESRGYWTCCWRAASASARLRSCWRRIFWSHAV